METPTPLISRWMRGLTNQTPFGLLEGTRNYLSRKCPSPCRTHSSRLYQQCIGKRPEKEASFNGNYPAHHKNTHVLCIERFIYMLANEPCHPTSNVVNDRVHRLDLDVGESRCQLQSTLPPLFSSQIERILIEQRVSLFIRLKILSSSLLKSVPTNLDRFTKIAASLFSKLRKSLTKIRFTSCASRARSRGERCINTPMTGLFPRYFLESSPQNECPQQSRLNQLLLTDTIHPYYT